jgi:hypothetical protein
LARKQNFNHKGDLVPPEWNSVYDDVYDDELLSIPIDTVNVLTTHSDQLRHTQEKLN